MVEMMLEQMIQLAEIEPHAVVTKIGEFIVNELNAANKAGAVIGVSGGIDSSVVASIANRAFTGTNLKLRAYYLPSETSPEWGEALVEQLLELLPGVVYTKINIQPIIDSFAERVPTFYDKFHRGNLAATVRAAILAGEAARHNMLVLGTGNREEYYLGYFTKRGDGAVDLQPILPLSKRMVRDLAVYLGLPDEIIVRKPTAGLWEGQYDEDELGMSYEEAELIINGVLQGFEPEEITEITGIGLDKVTRAMELHRLTEHKRRLPKAPQLELSYRDRGIEECTKALVIGRFQMVHIGHVYLFQQIVEHSNIEKLLIGIGTQGNTQNPGIRYLFSFEEVHQMLEPLLKNLGVWYKFYNIPDINNPIEYAKHVAKRVPLLDGDTVVVSGDDATLRCFAMYPTYKPRQMPLISSSHIRELMLSGRPWEHLVYNARTMKRLGYVRRL
ncbi:NAD(+) synthase, partial [Candidatus Woesearchaeota archaeon]